MAIAYLPGSSRPFGKLYSPLSLVTTVVAMVEPSFLALTRTPSMVASSAEDTFPVRTCAWALVEIPAWNRTPHRLALAKSERCSVRIESPPIESEGWTISGVMTGPARPGGIPKEFGTGCDQGAI